MDENLKVALEAATILDKLNVRWFLGGSLASSLYGVPRATIDADIVADLSPQHIKPLLAALGDDWYADEGAIRDAIANRSSCNLIHLGNAMKVDLFIPKDRRFDREEFERARMSPVEPGSSIEVPICCAEDIVVAKLEWFRLGSETSDRQWEDIKGVLKENSATLDFDLLRRSADELGVTDLLSKALAEMPLP